MIYLPALQALVETVGGEELTSNFLCLYIVQKHHRFTLTKPAHTRKVPKASDGRGDTDVFLMGGMFLLNTGTWI